MAITSKITSTIQPQRFEQIRDRIAEILMAEFAAQVPRQTEARVKDILGRTNFYTERFRPLNEDEMTAVVIFLFSGQYDNKHQTSVRGNYTFFLDVFSREPQLSNQDGDREAANNAQTVIGMVRAILEDSNWLRLGFDPNAAAALEDSGVFIETTLVSSIKRTEEENTRDAGNIIMYRIVFNVVANERTTDLGGVPITLSTTNVRIDTTENGYQYIFNPTD